MTHDQRAFRKGGGGSESGSSGGGKTGLGIEAEQAHALLIGVGEYKWRDWSIPVATSDVEALAETLSDSDHAGYPSSQVSRLTDAARQQLGIVGFRRNDFGVGAALLQHTGDALQRPACSEAGHPIVERVFGKVVQNFDCRRS